MATTNPTERADDVPLVLTADQRYRAAMERSNAALPERFGAAYLGGLADELEALAVELPALAGKLWSRAAAHRGDAESAAVRGRL